MVTCYQKLCVVSDNTRRVKAFCRSGVPSNQWSNADSLIYQPLCHFPQPLNYCSIQFYQVVFVLPWTLFNGTKSETRPMHMDILWQTLPRITSYYTYMSLLITAEEMMYRMNEQSLSVPFASQFPLTSDFILISVLTIIRNMSNATIYQPVRYSVYIHVIVWNKIYIQSILSLIKRVKMVLCVITGVN